QSFGKLSIALKTACLSATSKVSKCVGVSLSSAANSVKRSCLRPHKIKRKSLAKALAVALPIPEESPVINAVLIGFDLWTKLRLMRSTSKGESQKSKE